MTPRLQKLHDELTSAGFRPQERLTAEGWRRVD